MTQQSGHTSKSGPEVKDRQKRTKHGRGVARDGGIRNGITWRHPFSVQTLVKTKKVSGFWSKMNWKRNEMKKQGLYYKSVELWFHIIVWCHPKW